MLSIIWLLLFLVVLGGLVFQRASMPVWLIASAVLLVFFTSLSGANLLLIMLLWIVWLALLPLGIKPLRKQFITQKALKFYRQIMPKISRTEREALEAGTVWWDRDLFSGNPNWKKLMEMPYSALTKEEQDFINGPVNKLCSMINDWDITHNIGDMPPEMWNFIREQGFFGLIIPKQYGGKAFSAQAHAAIIVKLFSCSITVASTVAVPNSLGPAELLLHYGTDEQKDYYLPRLARGDEMPCFALTSPEAGSDAAAMPDNGIVCKGIFEGKEVLGIRVTWNKRYITLAPVATVLGLAFKLYDPEGLLGKKEELGITCALIPTKTDGVKIGRRHYPLNAVFQNGPTQGNDVFIPMDWVIGGQAMVGQGWRMLMECLSAGRSISLPSSGVASTKICSFATGAYSRIRRQFNLPIGRFEGIEEAIARIVGHAYQACSVAKLTLQAIDQGEKPAVLSGIIKYHCTELGRKVMCDAMDVHGGKGICLGPDNYLGRGYEGAPIGITVEGANILTRNMIIFGQGAMRCHPYALDEIKAAKMTDETQALDAFDSAMFGHIGFALSNFIRTFALGLSASHLAPVFNHQHKRYLQHLTRFSSAFAFLTDASMVALGSALKRKERISARLGDVLSYLYMASAVIKQHAVDGYPEEDQPLVDWACKDLLFKIQEAISDLLQNYPNKWLGRFLHFVVFPFGKHFKKPGDRLDRQLVQAVLSPTPTRDRLVQGIYLEDDGHNPFALLEKALEAAMMIEPIEKTVRQAVKAGQLSGHNKAELMVAATRANLISTEDYKNWKAADELRQKVIRVDDFSQEELTGRKNAEQAIIKKQLLEV